MRAASLIRITAFAAIISAPLVTMRGGSGSLSSEKRASKPRPTLAAAGENYPEQFDAFFRDNFGFREALIRWHHILKVKYLRESPVENVLIGSGGRLFFAGFGDGVDIRDFSGRWPYSSRDIDAWIATQRARRAEYAQLGARYIIVIAPSAQSVYPDDVPLRYGPHAPGVLDAFFERARRVPDLEIVDLRQALAPHRSESLYLKTDTHWNSRGAFYAAQEVVERVRRTLPAVRPLRAEDYDVVTSRRAGGDLANMLALADVYSDEEVSYRRRDGRGAHLIESKGYTAAYENADVQGPRLVVVGDSFGSELSARLVDSFARVRYYASAAVGRNPAVVASERPNVVVLCLVERYLARLSFE